MPMTWDARADAKLMANIMKVRDVRLSGSELAHVAELMGSECTPKAITHRMTHFRKVAASDDGGEPATPTTATPRKKATKAMSATPKGAKNGKAEKRGREEGSEEGIYDDEDEANKKVKTEAKDEDEDEDEADGM